MKGTACSPPNVRQERRVQWRWSRPHSLPLFACAIVASPLDAAPILNTGWTGDIIDFADTESLDSHYVYLLSEPAIFSISDQFVVDDEFYDSEFSSNQNPQVRRPRPSL
jgi:hypothetical protein